MIYSAVFGGVAVSAIQDLFEITAPADAAVLIHEIKIGQSSDYGDSEAEGLRVQLTRGHGTSGSGGSAVTPTPLEAGFAAAGSTVEANNTTQASAGTPVVLYEDAFNAQIGWHYLPTPEARIVLSPSALFVVELPVAPADAVTMSGTMIFEEIGG